MFDELLKVRRELLIDLSEDLTDRDFVIAQKTVDLFIDILEGRHIIEEDFDKK